MGLGGQHKEQGQPGLEGKDLFWHVIYPVQLVTDKFSF